MSDEEEAVWEQTPEATDLSNDLAPDTIPDRPAQPPDGVFSRIRWGLISFIILSVIVIVLAAQNTQSVTVRALGWEAELPLIAIILITVLVSVVLDELVGVIIRRRRRMRRAERQELQRLRREHGD